MPYSALPDHRIPYDNDGTVVGYAIYANYGSNFAGALAGGLTAYLSQSDLAELQDDDAVQIGPLTFSNTGDNQHCLWLFYPEQREVTGIVLEDPGETWTGTRGLQSSGNAIQGSNDTTNGVDGTWETASLTGGWPVYHRGGSGTTGLDKWRSGIKPVSFTGGKRTIRLGIHWVGNNVTIGLSLLHLYGEKAAGQTPDDLVFIDHDTTPGVEYQAPEDFGDRPLGTSVVRQFRVKNVSTTKTANSINIQCNDADFAISTDSTTWVVTINIASLAAGAQSSTMYIRNTTPAAGNLLGPRFARIVAVVGSWT